VSEGRCDLLGGDRVCGHDQVALVFAILGRPTDHDYLAAPDCSYRILTDERAWTLCLPLFASHGLVGGVTGSTCGLEPKYRLFFYVGRQGAGLRQFLRSVLRSGGVA